MRSLQLILPLVVSLAFGGCTDLLPCENSLPHRLPSPDGELDIVSFTRECGATTETSYHISVLPIGEPLQNEPGNTFVAGEPENLGVIDHGLVIGWRGDTVEVFYVVPREVHKQETTVAGRPVLYKTGDGIDLVY